MKVCNKLCQILGIALSAAAVVLFFVPFAQITANGGEVVTASGALLGFGASVSTETLGSVSMAKSADILFCLLLSALALVLCGAGFKFKGAKIAAPFFAVVAGIYMLVIALRSPWLYVDTRPLPGVSDVAYTAFVLPLALVLLGAAVFGFAHILVNDAIAVQESKGAKKTILRRFILFLRDYKSEIKKIVWPGPRSVVKNTLIVLVVCIIVGAFIWLLDFGLSNLLNLVLGTNG